MSSSRQFITSFPTRTYSSSKKCRTGLKRASVFSFNFIYCNLLQHTCIHKYTTGYSFTRDGHAGIVPVGSIYFVPQVKLVLFKFSLVTSYVNCLFPSGILVILPSSQHKVSHKVESRVSHHSY